MKVKTEFELNESELKKEIIDHCIENFDKDILESIKTEVIERFNSKIEDRINELLNSFLLEKEIIITDSWGDKKERYENGMELLKEKFDNYIDQKVDNQGRPVLKGCSYGNSETRIERLISKSLSFNFDKIGNQIYKRVESEINDNIEKIKADTTQKIISSLYDKIDIEAGIKAKK